MKTWDEMKAHVRQLKQLAKDTNLPILTTFHAPRPEDALPWKTRPNSEFVIVDYLDYLGDRDETSL